jgi:hypothetical protein
VRHSQFRSPRMVPVVVALVCFLWPSTAWANPIILPIAFVWPAASILLVPVVFIEAAVAVRVLGVSFRVGVWLSFWANLLSTVLGVPIGTCFNPVPLMFIGESDTSNTASGLLFWVSLLLPLYLLSVVAEAWVVRRLVDERHRQKARRWALLGNLLTHALISPGLMALALIDWLNRQDITAERLNYRWRGQSGAARWGTGKCPGYDEAVRQFRLGLGQCHPDNIPFSQDS